MEIKIFPTARIRPSPIIIFCICFPLIPMDWSMASSVFWDMKLLIRVFTRLIILKQMINSTMDTRIRIVWFHMSLDWASCCLKVDMDSCGWASTISPRGSSTLSLCPSRVSTTKVSVRSTPGSVSARTCWGSRNHPFVSPSLNPFTTPAIS